MITAALIVGAINSVLLPVAIVTAWRLAARLVREQRLHHGTRAALAETLRVVERRFAPKGS